MFVGIDGCRGGWYAVHQAKPAATIEGRIYETFGQALQSLPPSAVVAVDIPIGLTERGARPCDALARQFLSPTRASSVFAAPLRGVLGSISHTEASERRYVIERKRMSIQAYAITRKIDEVDHALRSRNSACPDVREVHPEVSFAHMNGDRPLNHTKKRAAGRAERMRLLKEYFGDAPAQLVKSRPKNRVAPDDVLDAFAALWSARRLGSGIAASLPTTPDWDAFGLPMAIFY